LAGSCNPSLKKLPQFLRWLKPDISGSFSPSTPYQGAQVRTFGTVDSAECGFVGHVVAKECDRTPCAIPGEFLLQNCFDGSAFIAADAKFQPGLKLKQRYTFKMCERFKQCARPLLD
jgi:hypothetical protein